MTLSRNDTAFLKGIAILMIAVHNFCHWLPRCVPENEYTFDAGRIGQYLVYVAQGGPHLVLNFFSHYGHYGVPLFLFLSGYGLVKKYEKPMTTRCATMTETETEAETAPQTKAASQTKAAPPFPTVFRRAFQETGAALAFIWGHAVKLWRLMIPAIVLLWICQETIGKGWQTHAEDLLKMVTYTTNLYYKRDLILGPWWFFSLILQLYVVYRLVLYPTRHWMHARLGRLSPHLVPGLCALTCLALQCGLYYADVRMSPDWHLHLHDASPRHWDLFNYCRYNFPGSMLPFALGIMMARDEQGRSVKPTQSATLIASAAVGTALLLVSAGYPLLWHLSPIFLLMALVPVAGLVTNEGIRRPLVWIGHISAALFALHPIVRAFTVAYAKHADQQGLWLATWGYLLLYLALSIAAAWLFTSITNKILSHVR